MARVSELFLQRIHNLKKNTSVGPEKPNLWPFYHYLTPLTLTFNLREKMFQIALFLLEDNNCAKLFWNPCINVPVMARTSSIYDHFDLYLTLETLTFNLPEKMFQMALLLLKDNNCAKLFWNPCVNVPVMARTSSIYDHFDPYLNLETLTFNLPEKMSQMALLLLKDNNCAKLFLKSMHKCTRYGPDKLNIWQFWHLFDPCDLDLQPTWKNVSNGTFLLQGNNTVKLFWNPCINVQVILRLSSIHVYDHFDPYLTRVTLTFNLPEKMFQMALLLLKGNNCAKLFWKPCVIVQVMFRTNPDGRTHIHRTKIVAYPQASSTIKPSLTFSFLWYVPCFPRIFI